MNKQDILKTYFGYDGFRAHQESVIDAILQGHDAITIMPTGGGKSLCYQIPSIMMAGIGIVISPLISLMKDQVNALNLIGVKSAFINSTLSEEQRIEVFKRANQCAYKIIYVAPEQLLTPRFLSFSKQVTINLISIDEAHCVSQWGQDFRPGYLNIKTFIDQMESRPVVAAFTATATQEIKASIVDKIGLINPLDTVSGFDRPNLYYEVQQPANKAEFVENYILTHPDQFGIVYCQTRKEVDALSDKLAKAKVKVASYHAGMSVASRNHAQDLFLRDEINVIIATNAFGMGIDKSNVSFVIHYNMPKNIESYYQEAGRAGRDGSRAECILLYGGRDVVTANFFIDNAEQNERMSGEAFAAFQKMERDRLRTMIAYSKTSQCLRQYVLDYFKDTSVVTCDNCSNCLGEFEDVDISVSAQKILSCIIRTQERFGAAMVVNVLRGSLNQKIKQYGFDQLSTHGIMKTNSAASIRSMIDFLLEEGVLIQSDDAYSVLKLTADAKEVLVGNRAIIMRTLKHKRIHDTHSFQEDGPLFDRLRGLRKTIADEKGVPAFVIFSDASLRDMCHQMPTTIQEFLNVKGVGSVKAEAYGDIFIECLNQTEAA